MKHTDLYAVRGKADTTKFDCKIMAERSFGRTRSSWNTLKPNLKIIYKDKQD
jgi:hypothetical protein